VRIRTNWLIRVINPLEDVQLSSEILHSSNITVLRQGSDHDYQFLDDEDRFCIDVITVAPNDLAAPYAMLHACFQSAILQRKRTFILGDLLRKMDPSTIQDLKFLITMYAPFFDLIIIGEPI
jgi:hypothetical protein